jgi:hypothetical protein
MTDTDARLWHAWTPHHRVLRVMLHMYWSAEAGRRSKRSFRFA